MKKINKLIKKKLSSGNVMAILDQVKKNDHLFKKADGFKREMGNGSHVLTNSDFKSNL